MGECTVSHQVLKELYHEIYKLHWSYLELEEGLQKLEEQRQLEGLLKKFLCVVPHNRKFFLPETFSVFKRTITQMKDFSVVKMLNGFESISQYANNLFTKPWRKEYRTIKMYSGFFVHEIKSNLVDAEELFLAMGYKKTANHELVLDCEICPDQVMNMSRDAMTAYTECKILNRIHSELTGTYKIPCTWADIFNYREQCTGGVTETIEAIRNLMMQRNGGGGSGGFVREKQLTQQMGPCFSAPHSSNNGISPVAGQQQPTQCIAGVAPCSNSTSAEYFGGNNNYHPHQMINSCGNHQQQQQGTITTQPLPVAHHHHHHPQNPYEQQQPGASSADLMTNTSFDSNYYHHPSQQQQQHGINGSLSSAVAAMSLNGGGGNPSACALHPMQQLNGGSYSTSAGHNMRMNHMDTTAHHHHHPQQQQLYAPAQNPSLPALHHHLHQQSQQAASICDYAPHTAMPHSKSMDHYSYPTVLSDLQQQQQQSQNLHHHHNPYETPTPAGASQFSRSHGSLQNGGKGYYEPTSCGVNGAAAAAAYNVSGTRYPLPYSLSSQFGGGGGGVTTPGNELPPGGGGGGGGQWGGGYYDVPNGGGGGGGSMLVTSNGGLNYPPNDCLAHNYQQPRGSMPRNLPPLQMAHVPAVGHHQPAQYYSDLIKPIDTHQQQQLHTGGGGGGGGYGESSDEVDRYGAQQLMNLRSASNKRDQQQQTPRSSDFDSYEELFGVDQRSQQPRIKAGDGILRNNSHSKGGRPDKIQDGVGSFESWDYVYQSLDQDQTRRPSGAGERADRVTNGKATVASKEAAASSSSIQQKTKTLSRENANKIQEHITNLRAVKPSSSSQAGDNGVGGGGGGGGERRQPGEREARRTSVGNHQKSNSLGGGGGGARGESSSSLLANGGGHQRQVSDSGLNGGHRVTRSNGGGGGGGGGGVLTKAAAAREKEINRREEERFPVESLPPPVITPDMEWSCRFCTFLNDNSRRICEMCAKSKDFSLEANGSATCV